MGQGVPSFRKTKKQNSAINTSTVPSMGRFLVLKKTGIFLVFQGLFSPCCCTSDAVLE